MGGEKKNMLYSLNCVILSMRRLDHIHILNLWTVIFLIMFILALCLSAYLFYSHSHSYASIEEKEEENDDL